MKNKATKLLLLLSSSVLLLSCCASDGSSFREPSSSVNPDTSLHDDAPTSWKSEDLADMASYLGEGNTIPFPLGFTADYVNASGTDEDGECFIVCDSACGDLSAQYEIALLDDGFAKYEDETVEEGYHFYFKEVDEGANELWVQTDMYENDFEIYAWIEAATPTYETFPYEAINETFGLTLSEANLPSFAVAAGELYDGYAAEDGSYFFVGGLFDETTTDEDFVKSYETALTGKGYTVDSENAMAINASVSLKVEYMAMEGYFFLQLSKYSTPAEGDGSVSFADSDFPAGYPTEVSSFDKDSFTFKFSSVCGTNNYVQFRKYCDKGPGMLWNVTSLGSIASLVVTRASSVDAQYYAALTLYVSDAEISDSNPGTKVSPTASGAVYTYTPSSECGYFRLIDENTTYASKNDSIVINYTL